MSGRLIGLDALRGIAALAVFLHHLHMAATGYSTGAAFLAVDLFFMLSGYVMARTYEERMLEGLHPLRFLSLRWKRLWPTMTVGAAIGVPVVWANYAAPEAAGAMLGLLFIPFFIGPRVFPVNGPAWSIFFELVANALHAVLLYRLSNRELWLLAAVSAFALVLSGWAYGLDVGSRPENFFGGIPRVLLSYTLGILLWRIWQDNPRIDISQSFALLAMPIFFVATTFIEGQSWVANLFFILAICPMMIAGALRFEASPFCSSVAIFTGAISFPLYAVHGTVLRLAKLLEFGWVAGGCAALLVTLAFPSVRKALPQFSLIRRQKVLDA